jgi:hypothetical protein
LGTLPDGFAETFSGLIHMHLINVDIAAIGKSALRIPSRRLEEVVIIGLGRIKRIAPGAIAGKLEQLVDLEKTVENML